MEYLPTILSVVQGISSISSGSQQAELAQMQAAQERNLAQLRADQEQQGLEIQSTQYRIQATAQRLEHERTASDVLRRINATQAAIRARAAAGGTRPFEGSAETVFTEAGIAGGREFDLSRENAMLSEQFGFLQADLLKSTGEANIAFDLASTEGSARSLEASGAAAKSGGLMKGLGYFAQAGYQYWKVGQPTGTTGGPQPKKTGRPSLIGDFGAFNYG